MKVQEVLNKHKHCNYWIVINHHGECILETDNLENLDKDMLNKEVEEYHNYCEVCTSEDYEGRDFIVAELDILAMILGENYDS